MAHPLEHERRWLVRDVEAVSGHLPTMVSQAYLFVRAGWCIRVRRVVQVGSSRAASAGHSTLCVKGPRQRGARPEYEWMIPNELAVDLYRLAPWRVVKSRVQIVAGGTCWDVDFFHHDNEGLVIAECEQDPTLNVDVPEWCGLEITEDTRYNNEELARHPWPLWRTP